MWQYIINRSTSRKEKKDELTVKKKKRLVQSMHVVNEREEENKK